MKIIIPAYQPDLRMLQLIDNIGANSDYGIIIVNDGSGPQYSPVFEQASDKGCIVLTHEENLGKGAALKTAFTYLSEQDSIEGFICADCDGQHAWTDIKRLAEIIPDNPASIVLGCRNFIGKVPFKSMFGNKITRSAFNLLTGNKITDTQTGLRGFSPRMLPWLTALEGDRYEYEMNQLLTAKKAGYSFNCIPIDMIYENNNEGSHFHPVRDSIRVFLPIMKFSLSSITCGILDLILLFLIKALTENLLIAVTGARIISSLCNFLLNKHLVFKAAAVNKAASFIRYYLLAAFILSMNYLLISFLTETVNLPLLFCKLLTEAVLFGISYTVQHRFIFRKNQ